MADCKIFAKTIEPEAIETIKKISESPENRDLPIRIMPDCHQGEGIVIGFTSPIGKWINPSFVGCDISCTISSIFFDKPVKEEDYPLLEMRLKRDIPMGFNLQNKRQFELREFLQTLRKNLEQAYQTTKGLTYIPEFYDEDDLHEWCRDRGIDLSVFYKSIGTVGGGNHFMEYDVGDNIWAFTVHCGSRNIGLKVWKYWSNIAKHDKVDKSIKKKIEAEVKSKVTDKRKLKDELYQAIENYKKSLHPNYLSGEDLRGYLTDMVICQTYADFNHKVILEKAADIIKSLNGANIIKTIQTRHNYIDFTFSIPIIRKGAVRSIIGEEFILPFNMRDGIAICEGKSNPDWNYSAPHGCGRLYSRTEAKQRITEQEYKKSMKGVYTTSIVLDEAPMAYKDRDEIIQLIEPTAKVLYFLKPVINLKADI